MNWKANLWILSLSVLLTSASYTMIIPFLPMYLLELGVAQEEVAMWSGAVFSASFFVGAVMAPIWGKIADKSGKRLMALRAGFCLSAVYFLGSLVTGPWQLLGVRILQGFANGFFPASLAIVSSSVPQEKLGFALGTMQAGQLVGGVLGPLGGGLLSHEYSMRASFVVAAVVLFLVTLAVAAFVREPAKVADKNAGSSILQDIQASMHNPLLVEMLALTVVIQTAVMILQPVVTLYIAELQGNMEGVALTAGAIFSLGGVAGAISAPLWGNFGQRVGYLRVMVMAFGGAGFFNFLQYFPDSVAGFGALQFAFGLFIVGVNPSISAIIVRCTSASFRGRVFGLATTANQFGAMLGPLLGGAIAAQFGIGAVFLLTGTLLMGIAALLARRHVYRKKPRLT